MVLKYSYLKSIVNCTIVDQNTQIQAVESNHSKAVERQNQQMKSQHTQEQSEKIVNFLDIVGDCPDAKAYRLVRSSIKVQTLVCDTDSPNSFRNRTGTLKVQ